MSRVALNSWKYLIPGQNVDTYEDQIVRAKSQGHLSPTEAVSAIRRVNLLTVYNLFLPFVAIPAGLVALIQ